MEDDGNKKRRAEKQWRREEVEAGLDERDEPVIEGNGIQVASTEELSKRRFVRVGRRRGAAPEATASPAPAPVFNFAAAAAAPAVTTEQPKTEEEKKEEAKAEEESAEKKEEAKAEEEKKKGGEEEPAEKEEAEKKPAEKEDEKKTDKPATPVKTVDFGKTPENITVSQFSFGLPATSSATTGGFVFGSTSTTTDSTAPATGFFFGAAPAKADSEKAEESKDEKKEGAATWTCNCCTEVNPESNATCSVCMVPRPAAPKAIEEGWTCACCTKLNPTTSTSCSVCMVPKPL